jgi:hypothetical protein
LRGIPFLSQAELELATKVGPHEDLPTRPRPQRMAHSSTSASCGEPWNLVPFVRFVRFVVNFSRNSCSESRWRLRRHY